MELSSKFFKLASLLLKFLLFLIMVTNPFGTSLQPSCHDDERLDLLQFKQSFVIDKTASLSHGAYPKVLEWKLEQEGGDCCLWDGIFCNVETGHVIGLNLTSSCLYGSIDSNSSLFRLMHLQMLCLGDNHFNYSRIPTAIRQLPDLMYLNLSGSVFFGQIPSEISYLSNLNFLDLSFNYDRYTGKKLLHLIDPDLENLVRNLTQLKVLHLGFVDISSKVPKFLANFSSLRWLRLENCGLHGEFPARIFKLPNLQALDLQMNQNLTGYLPEFSQRSPLRWLLLYGTSFSGNIPSSIERLDLLYELCVGACKFSGPIPSSLGKLNQLSILDLGENHFSGYIPSSLQNLTQLTTLFLNGNRLTGPIPSWLGNLTQLNRIYLHHNQFSGSIPHALSKLMSLQVLYLYDNILHGTVEFDMFFNMRSLVHIDLCGNNLSLQFKQRNKNSTVSKFKCVALCGCNISEFPYFLRHQRKLEWLELSLNKIHGRVPKWMGNTSTETLMLLDLSDNFLTGFQQPLAILPWVCLRVVGLSSNMLDGALPIPPTSTVHFDVSNNRLSGEITPLVCNLSSLWILDLSNNNFSGMIPHCLGETSEYLTVLNLKNNSFRGTIPLPFTCPSNLRMLDFSYNQFKGQLPRSLATCMMLESLDVKDNQLVDIFPSWLGPLPELKHLILGKNRFYGVIGEPRRSSEFPKLRVVDLSSNNFIGDLPSEYISNWIAMTVSNNFNSTYMKAIELVDMEGRYLNFYNYYPYSFTIVNKGVETKYEKIQAAFAAVDLSSNKFSGEIPEIIGNLKGLHSLNLSNNRLTGRIPPSLERLSELESLDLSRNKLSGEIPQQIVQLTFLANFNVSHNNLTGPIPQGNQLSALDNSSFQGNPGLCGSPLSKKCVDSKTFPTSEETNGDSSSLIDLNWKFVLAGFLSGLIVGIALGDMVIITKRRESLFKIAFRKRRPTRTRRGTRGCNN